jgi:hypothetical protein
VRLPGFTADAALERTGMRYRLAGEAVYLGGAVQPATIDGCFRQCLRDQAGDPYAHHNCRCLCSGGFGKTCWLI